MYLIHNSRAISLPYLIGIESGKFIGQIFIIEKDSKISNHN